MVLNTFDFIEDLKTELGSIPNKLIPNFFSFLVQIIALIVMIVVVMVILYKPIKKTLDTRASYIEGQIKDANDAKAISEENAKISEQNIIDSRKKASEIIANANVIAEQQKEAIIEEANKQVIRMKQEAEEDILKAKEEAQKEIHDEIVNVALDASKEILQREINEKDNSRLVEDFLKEVK